MNDSKTNMRENMMTGDGRGIITGPSSRCVDEDLKDAREDLHHVTKSCGRLALKGKHAAPFPNLHKKGSASSPTTVSPVIPRPCAKDFVPEQQAMESIPPRTKPAQLQQE